MEKEIVNINEINQIDARKGDNIISFKKIDINEIAEYNYKEISSDMIKGGFSNLAAAGAQVAAISALNPNGLFTATVTPQLLTLFSDGTFSTMIHQGGHIARHAGFQSLSATVFAPIAIMQLMSMITGQYYFNGITKQLKNIDRKINMLIDFHHKEKFGKLNYARQKLRELCDIQNPGLEDILQLKNIENEIGAIYHEYMLLLDDKVRAFSESNISSVSSRKEFDELLMLDSESGLYFYTVMMSDELLKLVYLIEFMINVKMNTINNNRSNRIDELYKKISELSENDFFSRTKGSTLIQDYYMPLYRKAYNITDGSVFTRTACEESLKALEEKIKTMKQDINKNIETLEIKTKIIESMTQPVELLLSVDDNGSQRIYCKQD